jgi:hypothetical protein
MEVPEMTDDTLTFDYKSSPDLRTQEDPFLGTWRWEHGSDWIELVFTADKVTSTIHIEEDNDDGGGHTSGGDFDFDRALVAKWHSTQAAADSGQYVAFEFTAEGILTGEPEVFNPAAVFKATTSNGRVSATITMNGQTFDGGSAAYIVNGTTLKFSNPTGAGPFVSLIAGQDLSLAMPGGTGLYYKKAGN